MKATGWYRHVRVDARQVAAVGSAGGVLLTQTAKSSGLDGALSDALAGWRKPVAVHHPGKVLTGLAVAAALGGGCLADAGLLRAEPALFGLVGSEATICRAITALAHDADAVLARVNSARRAARERVWSLAGERSPLAGASAEAPLIIDLDATLLTSHSQKEQAAATFKRGFGFHPLLAFADHATDGTGELLAFLLRPGNAGSNTAADHIALTKQALAAVPGIDASRPGRKVLNRADGGGGTKDFTKFLTRRGVSYSVGFTLPWSVMGDLYATIPEPVWSVALSSEADLRAGAAVADFTDLLRHAGHLQGWPAGIPVIVRRERPHPGARVSQERLDDVDGYRLTAFATNTRTGQLQTVELRHRRRARCEDRIRAAKDTGLRNLPLQGFDQNRIWCTVVALAADLTAWTQLLAFGTAPARRCRTQTTTRPDLPDPGDPGPARPQQHAAPETRLPLGSPGPGRPATPRPTARPPACQGELSPVVHSKSA